MDDLIVTWRLVSWKEQKDSAVRLVFAFFLSGVDGREDDQSCRSGVSSRLVQIPFLVLRRLRASSTGSAGLLHVAGQLSDSCLDACDTRLDGY